MNLPKFTFGLHFALTALALATAAVTSPAAWALGLGQAKVQSSVGEPLVADIELITELHEVASLRVLLAPAAEYQTQGVQFNSSLTGARVNVKKSDDGRLFAQIVTPSSVQDTYVQLIVEAQTSAGKVRRTYSLFIDPNKRLLTRLPGEALMSEMARPVPALPELKATRLMPMHTGMPAAMSSAKEVSVAPSGERLQPSDVILTHVSQRGLPFAPPEAVKSSGQNQPMQRALFSIVPKGWKGYATDPAVKFSGVASWQGSRDWLTALDGVLASAQLMATVDWDKREVIFSSISAQSMRAHTDEVAERAAALVRGASSSVPSTVAQDALSSPVSAPHDTAVSIKDPASPVEPVKKILPLTVQAPALSHQLNQAMSSVESLRSELALSQTAAVIASRASVANEKAMALDIFQLKAQQQELEKTLQTSRAALSALQIEAATVNSAHASEVLALGKRREDLQISLSASGASALESNAQLNTAVADSLRYRVQLKALESALARSEARLNPMTDELKLAQEKSLQSSSDSQRSTEDSKVLRLSVEQIKSQLGLASAGQAEAQAQLVLVQSRRSELESSIAALNTRLASVLSQAKAAESLQAPQTRQISELQAALAESSQQLAKSRSINTAQLNQIGQLNQAFSRSTDRLAAAGSRQLPDRPADALASSGPRARSLSLSGPALIEPVGVASSGLNVAFSNAIKQIIPAGWMVITDPTIANTPVSWNGNSRAWTQVLDELLTSTKLLASVDTAAREVIIKR